MKIVNIIGNG